MTRRTRTGLAALGAAALVVLGGCESENDPATTPTPSPTTTSASPTPSPSPSPSASPSSSIPAAAQPRTEKGAEAFARFYIDQSGKAWVQADPGLLAGLATGKCQTCKSLLETAEDLQQKGHRYDATPIKVSSMSRFSGTGDRWVFDAKLREQEVKVVDSKGNVQATYPAKDATTAIAVVWDKGHWWVDGIGE